MEPILDRNILAEGSEECGRIARKLRRLSEVEAFLDSFRVLRTEALIMDDCCLEDKRRAFDVFGEYNTLHRYISALAYYREYSKIASLRIHHSL